MMEFSQYGPILKVRIRGVLPTLLETPGNWRRRINFNGCLQLSEIEISDISDGDVVEAFWANSVTKKHKSIEVIAYPIPFNLTIAMELCMRHGLHLQALGRYNLPAWPHSVYMPTTSADNCAIDSLSCYQYFHASFTRT